jgi:hypothetical protein
LLDGELDIDIDFQVATNKKHIGLQAMGLDGDSMRCNATTKGFRYLLTKAKPIDERQRLQLNSAEEEISRTRALVYFAKNGSCRDKADKRRSIRRGRTYEDDE